MLSEYNWQETWNLIKKGKVIKQDELILSNENYLGLLFRI